MKREGSSFNSVQQKIRKVKIKLIVAGFAILGLACLVLLFYHNLGIWHM